eukprot:gene15488-18395_t
MSERTKITSFETNDAKVSSTLYAFILDVVKDSQLFVIGKQLFKPKAEKSDDILVMLDGLNYTYTDCIAIINLRKKFVRSITNDQSKIEELDKLWDLFAYMIYVVQTDKFCVTEDKWLTLSKQFGNDYLRMFTGVQLTSYLHTLIFHTGHFIQRYQCLFKYANFGIECRHKIIKKLIKASNHHFNYKLYRDILIQCYNWGNDTSTYVSNHKWTASEVVAPSKVHIGGKSYRTVGGTKSYFHLKKSTSLQ